LYDAAGRAGRRGCAVNEVKAETLNAAIAAHRAKQPPHVVQVFEVGTQGSRSTGTT